MNAIKPNLAAQWGARGLETFKSLGKRIFEHIAIFAAALAVALSNGSPLAGIYVYIGGICIIARGMTASPAWLIPASAGALQAAILALYGFPLPQALFWGGAQSWLQRLLWKRFCMGAEWIMLLFILPLAIHLLEHTPLWPFSAIFAVIALIGGILAWISRKRASAVTDKKTESPGPERVAMYRTSLAEFNKKSEELPASARAVAESIATRVDSILNSMTADPRDFEPGHRFLHRYFKAAHAVVDKHVALAREKVATPEIMKALSRSNEMLRRLDAVFAKEQARLLNNDVTDFSADLAVIDTLLKMDGR